MMTWVKNCAFEHQSYPRNCLYIDGQEDKKFSRSGGVRIV